MKSIEEIEAILRRRAENIAAEDGTEVWSVTVVNASSHLRADVEFADGRRTKLYCDQDGRPLSGRTR